MRQIGQHDDGHGAGLVGVLARRALRELRVEGREARGEEFVEGAWVSGRGSSRGVGE